MLSDEVLKHAGIKGMRWGVRRNRNKPGGADGVEETKKPKVESTVTDKRGRITKNLDSMKRERQWKSVLKDVDKLTTKEIGVVAKRVNLENSLKSLSKSKVGKLKDREDYLRRDKMDDAELSRKVTRLKAKEGLYKSVKDASKEQREFGQKVVQIGSSLGVKYALTKTITPKDIFNAIGNPKKSSEDANKAALEKMGVGKDVLEGALKKIGDSKS